MKTLKRTSVSILIMALLLAGCSPVGQVNTVVRGLANLSQIVQSAVSSQPESPAAAPTSIPASPANTTTTGGPAGSSANATGSDVSNAANTSAEVNTSTAVEAGSLAALQTTFEQVYEQVNPSVVNIQVEVSVSNSNSPFNRSGDSQGVQEGLGSGFVWDEQGHIVTNNHVVEGADRILVTFADDTTVAAEVVGTDAQADLAVIKVDPGATDLHPVTVADSSQVKVGQLAIAIGNPYGYSGTMTQGIISALERSLPVSESSTSLGQSSGSYTIPDIIQTDAAINPGNSGGVLVNAEGEVVGVTAAITSASQSNSGIGFVIPSNIVSRVVPVLIQSGKYDHPRLGISGMTLTVDIAEAMGLDAGQRGVVIMDVAAGGPADQAGLRGGTGLSNSREQVPVGGDIITAIDGQAIHNFEDLSTYLFYNTQVGQKITLTILRDGREQSVQVTLATIGLSQE